jgi:DNA-binding transcriptional ArsR family regulator
MDERPELYELETIEQLRAIADPLRVRIIELIAERPMTVTQVGEALGVPANKAHYHVRELERVGVARIVETREKSGILEKYFQTVARGLSVPPSLLSQASPDESVAAATEVLQLVVHNFLTAFSHVVRTQEWDAAAINLDISDLWVTPDELRDVMGKIREVLGPFQQQRSGNGVKRISFARLTHPTVEGSAAHKSQGRSAQPVAGSDAGGGPRAVRAAHKVSKRRGVALASPVDARPQPVVVAGTIAYSRTALEAMVTEGRRLDLDVLGNLTFEPDVSAELVDQAIAHVRHRGVLSASPEVKAVLERKGARPHP